MSWDDRGLTAAEQAQVETRQRRDLHDALLDDAEAVQSITTLLHRVINSSAVRSCTVTREQDEMADRYLAQLADRRDTLDEIVRDLETEAERFVEDRDG